MTLGTGAVSLAEANQCLFLVFSLHKGRPRSSVLCTHYLSHSILLEWLIISYNRTYKAKFHIYYFRLFFIIIDVN